MEENIDLYPAKRKSEDSDVGSSAKKRHFENNAALGENNIKELTTDGEGEPEENFEFNEVDDVDEYDDEEVEDDYYEEGEEERTGTITIGDDNYLSFSDNEISDERIQESRQLPDQPTSSASSVVEKKKAKKKQKKKKNSNLRKNIRNVLKDKQLDTTTQLLREKEMDRLKRLGLLTKTQNVISTSSVPKKVNIIKSTAKASKASADSEVICLSSSEDNAGDADDEDMEEPNNKVKKPREKSPLAQPLAQPPPPLPLPPPQAKKEVFVLSSDSEEEELDEEDESLSEHHSDLGLHTKDAFNKPEENGKVWVNLNNKESDEKIFLSRHISKILKPHQIGGLRFMFDNLIESVNGFQPSLGNGCILAHAMGLGKTIQTITFIDLFLRSTPAKKVLCVVPVNTIQNWCNEFNKWIPVKPVPCDTTEVENETKHLANIDNSCDYNEGRNSLPHNGRDLLRQDERNHIPQDRRELIPQDERDLLPQDGREFLPQDEREFLPQDETSDTVSMECNNIHQNNNDFLDFGVIKELLDTMVEFIDENTDTTNDENQIADNPKEEEEEEEEDDIDKYRNFNVFLIDAQKTWPDRVNIIDEWVKEGGVLLIGYEMYRMVASGLKSTKFKGKKGKLLLEEKRDLKQAMKEAICDPGPDLVVCDEGHRIKNYQSGISQSLKSIRTRKRLVLTGYPLQNNLMEYWCMVDFVRPDYLGSRQEFANMFERPILNGQCVDSTPGDKRVMRERAHVLYSLLQGFVQRRGHKVFKAILPEKHEHVVMVRMSPIQKALYDRLVELTKEAYSDSLNPIKTFHLCCKIWNHPDILYKAIQASQQGKELDIISDEDDIDSDSSSSMKSKRKRGSKLGSSPSPAATTFAQEIGFNPFSVPEPREILMDVTQWAPEIFRQHGYKLGEHENSGKFTILRELIKESLVEGDKMLIFSQSLLTLNTIEDMLLKTPVEENNPDTCWKKGEHYFRLDGSTSSNERERIIDSFNKEDNTKAKLFLLSTRAGCLGINLIAANRVVVFDVSWNPCHDAQAVCRIYRYGQTKPCYIYRFVASNTMEKKIYYRQISKQGISNRVVDEMNQTENFSKNEIQSLMVDDRVDEGCPDFGEFVTTHCDRVLNCVILNCCQWLTKVPFKHESLLINEEETEKLTGSEKRAAKRAYEVQKQMSRPGYRSYPLQQNFPSNTPVAPVRPFLWRPPLWRPTNSNTNSSYNISSSFPVMVGNSGATGNHSMARAASYSSPASTSNPLLNNLLSTIRQSLSTSNLIPNTSGISPTISTDHRSSSPTTQRQQTNMNDNLTMVDAAQRRKEIEDLLMKTSSNNQQSNDQMTANNSISRAQDIARLNYILNLSHPSPPPHTPLTPSNMEISNNSTSIPTSAITAFHQHHPTSQHQQQRSRPTSSASNDVIVLDDSDED